MKKMMIILFSLLLIGCAVGWGKPLEINYIQMPNDHYQIVVDGDPLLTNQGKMMIQFHKKAQSLCPNYEVISIKQIQGHAGAYSASMSNISGIIQCKPEREK